MVAKMQIFLITKTPNLEFFLKRFQNWIFLAGFCDFFALKIDNKLKKAN